MEQAVTIAFFTNQQDAGLRLLQHDLASVNVPCWVEELEAESADEALATTFPFRLRVHYLDRRKAYSVWLHILEYNNPYVEITEAELEQMAIAAGQTPEQAEEEVIEEEAIEGDENTAQATVEDTTAADWMEWISESLCWIEDHICRPVEQPIVTIEEHYADWEFMADLEDADFVLQRTLSLMHLDEQAIDLYFIHATETAGQYHFDEAGSKLGIEVRSLWSPSVLIDVVAHELCHHRLIGMSKDKPEEDEWLTDLLQIAYGFGVIKGNMAFIDEQSGHVQGGWASLETNIETRGYLTRESTAFALALIAYRQSAALPEWTPLMGDNWRPFFVEYFDFIAQQPEAFQFTSRKDA